MARVDQRSHFEQLSGKLSNYQRAQSAKMMFKISIQNYPLVQQGNQFSDLNGPLNFFNEETLR